MTSLERRAVIRAQSHWTLDSSEGCAGLARLELAVDEIEQKRRQQNPRELVPVEERKAEERGRSAGIELRKAESEVGERQQYGNPPGGAFSLLRGGKGHGQDAITLSRLK